MKKYPYPNCVLMIFCKTPVPGQVKTRLIPALSPQQAANLHRELSVRTIDLAITSQLCPVQLWCSPTTQHPFFDFLSRTYPLSMSQQQGVDLGERMHLAFSAALSGFSAAVIIGCDCPSLTSADLAEALTKLAEGKDAVIAAAEDGGYTLIGLKRTCPELFVDMPWGSSEVLTRTLLRLDQYGLDHAQLKSQWDIDTPEDLLRYRNWQANPLTDLT